VFAVISVGVDLSTSPARTALATIEWAPDSARLSELIVGVSDEMILERAVPSGRVVGLDSPLGWPDLFVDFVREQQSGTIVSRPDHEQPLWRRGLSYRATDEVVRELLGLVPLSVSTDRLGLVAMRAASLMADIVGPRSPLDRSGRAPVIEVYPSASLRAWQLPSKGYKSSAIVRRNILTLMNIQAPWLEMGAYLELAIEVDHAFDALVAGLTVRSWQIGKYLAPGPAILELTRREGWIVVPTSGLGDLLSEPTSPTVWDSTGGDLL